MLKRLILICILLTGISSAEEVPVTITPLNKITTADKNLQAGTTVEFKDVATGELVTGLVKEITPNGFAGEQASILINNFKYKNSDKILNGEIFIKGGEHKKYQEMAETGAVPVIGIIRGGEVVLKPEKTKLTLFFSDYINSEDTPVQIKPAQTISTCYDEIEVGDKIKFISVKDISKKEDYFIIDEDYQVKTVIIATGNGAFNPKKLPLKISPKVEDKINYFIKDPKQFNNKTIAILGGGDSALDWAAEFGKTNQIKLIHRREQFRGLEATLEEIKNLKNVEIITPYIPKGLELVDNHLKLNFKKVGDDENKEIACDEIIVAYGFKANNRFVKKWGIEFNGTKIAVNSVMQTNLSGIYAVGDAVDYSGRVPIIGVGFGEVQIAITDIMRKLFPEKTLTIHSTSM